MKSTTERKLMVVSVETKITPMCELEELLSIVKTLHK
jgi:hypothetical protein